MIMHLEIKNRIINQLQHKIHILSGTITTLSNKDQRLRWKNRKLSELCSDDIANDDLSAKIRSAVQNIIINKLCNSYGNKRTKLEMSKTMIDDMMIWNFDLLASTGKKHVQHAIFWNVWMCHPVI